MSNKQITALEVANFAEKFVLQDGKTNASFAIFKHSGGFQVGIAASKMEVIDMISHLVASNPQYQYILQAGIELAKANLAEEG